MSNGAVILDDNYREGLNTYRCPDLEMRKANGCRLKKGYLANLSENIRAGRNKIRVTGTTTEAVAYTREIYLRNGCYTPSQLVSEIVRAKTKAYDPADPNTPLTFPLVYELAGDNSDMYRFRHETDSIPPFTVTFESAIMAKMFGFAAQSNTSSAGTLNGDSGVVQYLYAVDAVNDTIDKAIILTCDKVLAENRCVCTGYYADGKPYPIIMDQYFCTFLLDGSDPSIIKLDEPITHTNIFKSGGCSFRLWYATGEPVDLNGGYIILDFEFL